MADIAPLDGGGGRGIGSFEPGRGMTSSIEQSFPLRQLAEMILAGAGGGWRTEVRPPWCVLNPAGVETGLQGWKLHVSATPLSAPLVLAAALPVLADLPCQAKFAATLADARELTGARAYRGSGGKFLTIYPVDDEQFRALAERLDAATAGLPGPAILSDRRYRKGSLVHYRYGAFRGVSRLGEDGVYESGLLAPDGTVVADQRKAWFTPPPWAADPFVPGPATVARPSAVVLHDRYEVRRALQHANKGGVFEALDRRTGDRVVIKQARPHTQASVVGTDSRDLLRQEARMLAALAGTGVAPRLVETFEQDGDGFLAEEFLPGEQLRTWVARRIWAHGAVPAAEVRTVARGLVALLAAVHGRGLVLRDLSPNNILVDGSLDVRLVDLEHAVEAGATARRAFTPGYGAPEVEEAPSYGPAPGPAADLFALGATLFHLATGRDPVFLAGDRPEPVSGRLTRVGAAMGTAAPGYAVVGDVVRRLTAADPGRRIGLAEAAAALTGTAAAAPRPATPGIDEAIDGGLRTLRRRLDLDGPRELHRSGAFGTTTDRCAVQHGAAGPLAVLVRAARAGRAAADRELVAGIAGWVAGRLAGEPRELPGLYFGRAGVAWALADAADLLGDPGLRSAAEDLAGRLPLRWPNPDVCHGAAGAGLAQLRLWQSTGATTDRVLACADGLADAADTADGEVWFPVPATFPSAFAGAAQPGFGHGTAGVATFLLRAAQVTGRDRYLDLAVGAGRTLARRAVVEGPSAWWPADRSERPAVRRSMSAHWCAGASGIGTFLIRLWAETGDDRWRDLADRAAETAWRARWTAAPVQCHGSAGDGELFLDLAELTGDDRYRRRADEIGEIVLGSAALRAGELAFPDETYDAVVPDFQTGLAGTLAFLLRLRHGGARSWLPDGAPAAAVTQTPVAALSGAGH